MMTTAPDSRRTKVQKLCTLYTHGENQFDDEVVINEEKFPELNLVPGTLVQIFGLKQGPAVRDFQSTGTTHSKDDTQVRPDISGSRSELRRARSDSVKVTYDESGAVLSGGREVDPDKTYIFRVRPMSTEWKNKHPNLQISIAEKVAKIFGFRNRQQVVLTEADEERVAASHVEITFRDEYLARADMWRMAISELSNRTVYRGQRLLFIGTIKATVKNIYINGKSTHSGYFSSMTKPIFRSESARYVLFIQMSKEMWDFDAEGAGEIMFNKVVHGFLPDLFKRWMKINARHLVTIILFTRMSYDGSTLLYESSEMGDPTESYKPSQPFRDYYRVVVSDMASGDWIRILYQLKKEFRAFLRDVSLVPKHAKVTSSTQKINTSADSRDVMVAGKPCPAAEGNMLEAINLASAQFAKDYIDRDLVRTGISAVVITAGTGVFEVDYNMLKLTTDTLIGSGIGIDLVCLSPMPLHSVPLFKYRTPRTVADLAASGSKDPKRSNINDTASGTDEKSHRQFQHNLDSVLRQPSLVSKPSLSALKPPPVADTEQQEEEDWKYAMPHWLDISFWSGPSDEIVELVHSRPGRPIGQNSKNKKKGSTFALRCRMYELQMMGVMENELHGISIPYMDEDPIYPYQLKEYYESPPPKKLDSNEVKKGSMTASTPTHDKGFNESRDQRKKVYQEWMEKYDGQAFSTISDVVALAPPPRLDSPEKKRSIAYLPDERFLSSSYRSFASSLGKTARPRFEAGGHLHSLMRERSRGLEHGLSGSPNMPKEPEGPTVRADVVYRQTHAPPSRVGTLLHHRDQSIPSTPDESPPASRGDSPPRSSGLPPLPIAPAPKAKPAASNRPGGWFLRQISFGGRGATSAKSTASIAPIDFTMGKPEPIKARADNSQKDAIAAKLASTRTTEAETPSQPIAIRSASRAGNTSSDPPATEDNTGSVETVKGHRQPRTSTSSRVGSVTKDPGSTFLLAGSRALAETVGPKLELAPSGRTKDAPRTLSPTNAIAPWAVLVNPCNPRKNSPSVASQFRRWQHVFPKRLKTSSVKWKSLCSPAAVPLTNEYFPTAEQLATEYNESPYKIAQNDDDDLPDSVKSRETLVRELIAFRLSHGFQIIVGPTVAEVTGIREEDISNILDSDYMTKDGDTVFMSLGNTIHQLVCVAGGEVEVKRFTRKPTTALESSAGIDTPFPYRPFIRTALEDHYQRRDVVLRPPRKEYNWNFIDTFLAGYDNEFSDILRFWRARFVLIPVEIPPMHRRTLASLSEDSEEEIRLEGIRKLTQLWQRYRYIPPEERHFQATSTKKQRDPNPLAILYHTRDPSAIVAAAQDSSILNDLDNEFQTAIFSETDKYHTSNIDLKRLAEDLQGENGIPMLDRRWHWRLHYNCFLGFDLTSWLLSNFRDIETRDEAVDLGNQLMQKGLFQHVQKRHQFRDGNFFFQIAPEYRTPRPDTRSGWFSMKKPERSVPSTPLSEGPRSSPLGNRSVKSRPGTTDSSSTSDAITEGERTPTRTDTAKRKVSLSRVMRYDVDARKRSYRPEIISLHYDRLHNPDNCYHIRIDWMNVTAKLIEDAIVTWATSVEKYGLKLVEVPIAEASNITDHHPFRSPYHIKLALQPPQNVSERNWDPSHLSPQPKVDRFALHKALLRKLNYVLDMEAASAFPPDVDVTYSWGKPDYKYTQFIHRTGTLLAQITDEGDFLLLANRLAHNRAKDNGAKFRHVTDPYEHKRPTAASTTNPSTPAIDKVSIKSPFASPLARPVQDPAVLQTILQERSSSAAITASLNSLGVTQTPEQIKDETEAFCADPVRLRQFYEVALQQQNRTPGPSPHLGPVSDASIPSLGLPPAINIREANPAAGSGWALMGGGGLIATPRIETARDLVMARRQGSEEGRNVGARRGAGDGVGTKGRRDSQGSSETFMS
ncbi:uncharacterized protein EI97DRAFT_424044 [Westerdykella ornata]|uniref:Vacuolar membrane-associated protein IML1 n=1 Tax=Westerdykella ornata TaxID=318751 RepID=A0A6A6JD06_WESOR|nr:uncharacterized protein EI97DRAFT_424044 [Westerdykella ornata]KAF2273506.1 hypothetical protein EI97DRAFT_424044 [Westerdykella ornata]